MFGFRLCLHLGIPHPDYLFPQLTSRQLAEWMAAYNIEPFGEDLTRMTIAKMAATLVNQRRSRGTDPIEEDYFLPAKRPRQSIEEMKLALRRHLPSGAR